MKVKQSELDNSESNSWYLDSMKSSLAKLAAKVAGDAVKTVLLDPESSAYIGQSMRHNDEVDLSVFIDNFVLYFSLKEMIEDMEHSDRGEIEAVSSWAKKTHEELEALLVAKKPCPYCGNPIPKIHKYTCCDACFEARRIKGGRLGLP